MKKIMQGLLVMPDDRIRERDVLFLEQVLELTAWFTAFLEGT